MRGFFGVVVLAGIAAAEPSLEEILAVLEARERATAAFAAEYFATEDGVRIGPRRFAWRADRSLYRGPKRGGAVPYLRWLTGDTVERESLYYKDGRDCFWLHRERQPVTWVWHGMRRRSRGPDFRRETGFHWDHGPLGEHLRKDGARVVGREAVDGRPCVRLQTSVEFPEVFWLSLEDDLFPLQALQHNVGTDAPEDFQDGLEVGDTWYFPTTIWQWEELRRSGPIVYPLRVRIRRPYDEPEERVIEVVPRSVRFGDDVTDEDFALPALFLAGGAVHTPVGRVAYGFAITGLVLLVAAPIVLLWWRRRRRA